jgi:hypothetical protein
MRFSNWVAVLAVCGMRSSRAAANWTLSTNGLTVYDTASGITCLADTNFAAGNRCSDRCTPSRARRIPVQRQHSIEHARWRSVLYGYLRRAEHTAWHVDYDPTPKR